MDFHFSRFEISLSLSKSLRSLLCFRGGYTVALIQRRVHSSADLHCRSRYTKRSRMSVTWQNNSSLLALLGGMLVGSVAATRLTLIGKITGISGIVNGSSIYKLDKLPFEERVGKVLFVCGLSLGGLLCYYLLPQAFLDWSSVPLERPIVGGFLVGFGSAIGNGCTSGHGVCGISSMRVRSIVATGVFMTTGILTAIFTNSLRYFPEFDNSLAGYAIVCYLMWIKDRHNGNILIDKIGHLCHIDYGFILGISPGGNLGFETAAFKLTKEMIEVLGGYKSEVYNAFVQSIIRGFLIARKYRKPIVAIISAYADSGLPCFNYKQDILQRLNDRFFPTKRDSKAATKMYRLIQQSAQSNSTYIYDVIQNVQQNIFY